MLVVRDVRIIREATSFRQDGPGKKSTWSLSVPTTARLHRTLRKNGLLEGLDPVERTPADTTPGSK